MNTIRMPNDLRIQSIVIDKLSLQHLRCDFEHLVPMQEPASFVSNTHPMLEATTWLRASAPMNRNRLTAI